MEGAIDLDIRCRFQTLHPPGHIRGWFTQWLKKTCYSILQSHLYSNAGGRLSIVFNTPIGYVPMPRRFSMMVVIVEAVVVSAAFSSLRVRACVCVCVCVCLCVFFSYEVKGGLLRCYRPLFVSRSIVLVLRRCSLCDITRSVLQIKPWGQQEVTSGTFKDCDGAGKRLVQTWLCAITQHVPVHDFYLEMLISGTWNLLSFLLSVFPSGMSVCLWLSASLSVNLSVCHFLPVWQSLWSLTQHSRAGS